MSQYFDFTTIIFMVIALFVFLRLRNTLGTRTGTEEKPPQNDRVSKTATNDNKGEKEDNVVSLPISEGVAPPKLDADTVALKRKNEITKIAGGNEDVQAGLLAIADSDQDFWAKEFLAGARSAYEMIVTAFASGDQKTLRNLLDKEVYESFSAVITDRESRKENVEFTFVGFNGVSITDAELENSTARISIHFKSQVISATKTESGELIDGDEVAVTDIADAWTFSRSMKARDPNWKLVATNTVH